jgi:hypothetical protein
MLDRNRLMVAITAERTRKQRSFMKRDSSLAIGHTWITDYVGIAPVTAPVDNLGASGNLFE